MFSCFVILKESNLRDYPSYSVSIYKWLEEHRLRQLCSLYTLYKWFQEHRLRQLCSLYTLYKWLHEYRVLCSLYILYKWLQKHRLRQLCSLYTLYSCVRSIVYANCVLCILFISGLRSIVYANCVLCILWYAVTLATTCSQRRTRNKQKLTSWEWKLLQLSSPKTRRLQCWNDRFWCLHFF